MALTSKTFRIFVSSTFSDLEEERNVLQEKVFPELRKLCMEHGFRFQAIDLRWGVSKEATLSQETMRICLQEIKRCQAMTPRPNFIILLGDRYGWQPIPEEIPGNEFKQIKEVIKKHRKDFDRIAEEVSGLNAEEILGKWYKEDKNAVPPVHILQPVDPESKYTDSELWDKEVMQPLLHILRKAIKELGLSYEERMKYEASATHQEIELGAMKVDDADEHVFGFFRQIKNLDDLKREDLSEQPAQDFVDTDVEDKFDKSSYEKLKSLKERLGEKLGKDNVIFCDAEWQGNDITTTHLDKLCKDVYDNLSGIIRKQIDQMDEKKPLEKEIEAHEDFRKDRAKHFIGRADMLEKIKNYTKDENNHLLTIHGKSGTGKSALLAFAVKKTNENFPKAAIAFRSIGATPSSSDGRSLLESLCRQVSKIYEADETDIPLDYEELIKEFPKRLALATPEKPLILFIDALDQLSDVNNARNLNWLPYDLPKNVKLIVSTLPGECYEALKRKLPEEYLKNLKPMPPAEGEELLNVWLEVAHRTLQPKQRKEILDNFNREDNGKPLYLQLAFNEARRWKSYTKKIKLSPDIPGIVHDLFKRLSLDENHGEMMVSRSLGYLAAAKNGLSEDELLDVLSDDEEFFRDFLNRAFHKPPENRLPVIVWSRLYFDLEPYLIERSADGTSLMIFYHRQFREVVKNLYLDKDNKRQRHTKLATYFNHRWQDPSFHAIMELPYQQVEARLWQDVINLLSNTEYLKRRIDFQDTPLDIGQIINSITKRIPATQSTQEAFDKFASVFLQQQYTLVPKHRCVITQLYPFIRILSTSKHGYFAQWIDRETRRMKELERPWLCCIATNEVPASNEEILTADSKVSVPGGHNSKVNTLTVFENGKFVISGANDGNVILWDIRTLSAKALLQGHDARILNSCISHNEQLAATCDAKGKLIVWNNLKEEPIPIKIIEDSHPDVPEIMCCSISPDERTIAYGKGDGSFKLRSIKADGLKRTFIFEYPHEFGIVLKKSPTEEEEPVNYFPVTKTHFFHICDSLFVFSHFLRSCERRNLLNFELQVCYGSEESLECATLSANNKFVLAGTSDGRILLFDSLEGSQIQEIKAHDGPIKDCALNEFRLIAVTVSKDGEVKIWDLRSGREVTSYMNIFAQVSTCRFLGKSHKIIVGTVDGHVLRLGKARPALINRDFQHSDRVCCVALNALEDNSISVDDSGEVKRWRINDKDEFELTAKANFKKEILSCSVQAQGQESAFGCADGHVILWNHTSGNREILGVHDRSVVICDYHDQGFDLLTGDDEGVVTLWDTFSKKKIWSIKAHDKEILACAVRKNRKSLITTSADGSLKIHDLARREVMWELNARIQWLSSDGCLFAVHRNSSMEIRDIILLEKLAQFQTTFDELTNCVFSPLGEISAAITDYRILLYAIGTQKLISSYTSKSQITCTDLKNSILLLGFQDGGVKYFTIKNLVDKILLPNRYTRLIFDTIRKAFDLPENKIRWNTAKAIALQNIDNSSDIRNFLNEMTNLWISVVGEIIGQIDEKTMKIWQTQDMREKYLASRKTACDFMYFIPFL